MSRKAAGPPTLSILWMLDSAGERRQHPDSGVTCTTLLCSARNSSPYFSLSRRPGDRRNLSGVVLLS